MFDQIETLSTLAATGTMTRTATQLRITQSTVSKRIAALEREVGQPLTEAHGRGVRLTPVGHRLLERAAPLVAALRQALREEETHHTGRLALGISESILASWGPRVLATVRRAAPEIDLQINAHRSPAAIERVRAGEYALALAAGVSEETPDLRAVPLLEEPMVLVPANLKPFTPTAGTTIPVLTIESGSATWTYLQRRLRHQAKKWRYKIEVTRTLQSFTAIVQMARSGFGHGLVPLGVARALGIRSGDLIRFPAPGLTRPISLIGRPTTLSLPLVQHFHQILVESLKSQRDAIV
ncbi:LysR family transcriptional regulator [bacterium]|nr:LysR family transcriptional regulator [bacterium]